MEKKKKTLKKETIYIIASAIALIGLTIGCFLIFSKSGKQEVDIPKVEHKTLKIGHKEDIELSKPQYIKKTTLECSFDGIKDTKGEYVKINAKVSDGVKKLVSAIEKKLKVELDGSWRYYAHIDTVTGYSYISLKYFIADVIETDKSITIYSDGKDEKQISYQYLKEEEDEAKIKKSYEIFKNNSTQERTILKDNERYTLDNTKYTYYYSVNKLVYKYTEYIYNDVDKKILTSEAIYIVD